MRDTNTIFGFWERVDEAVKASGYTKADIARKIGGSESCRKLLYRTTGGMNTYSLMKFCYITGVSADWLLGLRKEKNR